MLDPKLEATLSKAYAKIGDISYTIALNMQKGKDHVASQRVLKSQGIRMALLLKTLYRDVTFTAGTGIPVLWGGITEVQVNEFLRHLIQIGELDKYPVVPSLLPTSKPVIISTGAPGSPGPPGSVGPQGLTGLATDFIAAAITTPLVIDSFDITDAKGGRWDYVVEKSTGEQRTGSIIAKWNSAGVIKYTEDISTDDVIGDTGGMVLSVVYSAPNIQLVATPASGIWEVAGSRYFIPNNGNGSGPVGDVLADGKVYIGNASNQATARSISGAIAMTNTGVVSINNDYITNAMIAPGAAIALSKLATLNNNIVVITNGSGQMVSSTLNPTTLGYVDIGSSLTALLNAKLTNPLTTNGDILIYNGGAVRLASGGAPNDGKVLTLSGGIPAWMNVPGGISGLTAGYIPKASNATTIVNSLISESGSAIHIAGTLEIASGYRTQASGPYLKTKVMDIGDWNMISTSTINIPHGILRSKIRTVTIIIRDDSDLTSYPLGLGQTPGQESFCIIDDTNIVLDRLGSGDGGIFDNTNFNSTSFNRGWVTITYEA